MKFYKYDWIPYFDNRMQDKKIKSNQISKLFYTGLYEGVIGKEYTFLPTETIKESNSLVESLYKKIKTINHKIELCNEIFYTTKIEGSHTTYQRTIEIHDGKPIEGSDYFSEMMVKSGFEATKFLNVHGNKLNSFRKI